MTAWVDLLVRPLGQPRSELLVGLPVQLLVELRVQASRLLADLLVWVLARRVELLRSKNLGFSSISNVGGLIERTEV